MGHDSVGKVIVYEEDGEHLGRNCHMGIRLISR